MSNQDVLQAGRVSAATKDGIATVRFAHPKSNSLPSALLRQLAEKITLAGSHAATRVIVLASEGDGVFCGGASFDEFKAVQQSADPEAGRRFFAGFAQVILAMIRAPQFILTRVQGKVAGGGVGLVAASDYALALRGADLKLSELAVGLGPFVVGPVIERKIGLAAFSALAVEADWRNAEWAERHGLYSELFDDAGALDARVATLATKLAAYNPEAVRRLKQTFWGGTEGWDALLVERAAISGTLVLSEHTRRAIGG